MYIYIYISLPFTFTIIVCTIKNTFYIVSFFIYFLTIPASRLPKPKTHKTFILHRQRHMGVLCKSGLTRVPTRMFAYNKQKKWHYHCYSPFENTHRQKPASFSNQPTDLLGKSINWFLRNTSPNQKASENRA